MRISGAVLGLLAAGVLFGGDDAPAWLRDLSSVSLPSYEAKVTMVVLLDEERTTVGDSGKLTTTTRTALKILARQGVDPIFLEQYDTQSGKIRDFKAWMISPSGKVKKYGKEEIIELACAENDVYNQCRERMVSGKRDVEAGAVFGYESVVEHQAFGNQLSFHFQDSMPVRLARFEVTVPSGWEVKTTSFNGAPKETALSGGTYSWQMENLPALERETASPSFRTVAPWVGVNLLGPNAHAVMSWAQAAKLLSELSEGQWEPTGEMAAKAKALTEGLSTEMDKIRAIGKFVQQVNYVSIQVNIAKGGGYKPHPASQVFQKLYGDCKDKANLMRAMLKAVGITAYPVAVYSGDRTHVSAEWASLGSFNHAISAIRVSPETKAPAVLDDPKLGRLLFFDPTSPYVPAGFLPEYEQASFALVAEGDAGDLVKLPAGAAVAAAHERTVEAALKADGSIDGSFQEKYSGEAFSEAIGEYRGVSKTDYVKHIERWVGGSIRGAATSDVEAQDNGSEFVLKGKFGSKSYAQSPQPRMMIFHAGLLRHGEIRLTQKTRKYPVVLHADALAETVKIALPEGYKVDELPDKVHLNSPFGKFEASWTVNDRTLLFERKLEMPAQSVPVAQYADLRRFLDVVMGSAEAPVVLMK